MTPLQKLLKKEFGIDLSVQVDIDEAKQRVLDDFDVLLERIRGRKELSKDYRFEVQSKYLNVYGYSYGEFDGSLHARLSNTPSFRFKLPEFNPEEIAKKVEKKKSLASFIETVASRIVEDEFYANLPRGIWTGYMTSQGTDLCRNLTSLKNFHGDGTAKEYIVIPTGRTLSKGKKRYWDVG